MRSAIALTLTAALLTACGAPVPDARDVQGVGFGTLEEFQTANSAQQPAISGPFVQSNQISAEEITNVPTVEPQRPAVSVTTNNPGISDEQDFSAVASRESIESDRERLEAQRQAFQVVETTALPTRRGNSGPSIVSFAISTNHAVGVAVYKRNGLSGAARFARNCAKYASSDLAQAAFLGAGGPERDRFGIDPDGDGFACYWDPAPFRTAISQ